ncbi:hypothetical protein [Pseudoalteromonas lipolytica]|uniref:hypothetical protein n=1 Tax=Pseudoalteromonas lipolytica TaxID=570156 RepID=UPI0030B24FBC
MKWLIGKRIAIVEIKSADVNAAIIKGKVENVNDIGLSVYPDKGSAVSLTWGALNDCKIIQLTE